ncbi:hypothetical protein [Paraburkholderia sediminicola]|uniref:hypothetical protein n=1 Tax=Paraburkholderia sediminicola TaxID=458836 RepID=UPI0038BD4B0D
MLQRLLDIVQARGDQAIKLQAQAAAHDQRCDHATQQQPECLRVSGAVLIAQIMAELDATGDVTIYACP